MLWKNTVSTRRSKGIVACALVFPLVLFPLLIVLRESVKRDYIKAQSYERRKIKLLFNTTL